MVFCQLFEKHEPELVIMNKKTEVKVLGVRVSAILEIIFFLLIISLASYAWGNNDRFINISPHPYWVILILIVVQYDMPETICCIILMILFMYIGNVPKQEFTETTFDYYFSLCLQPILWFAMGTLTTGIVRKRFKQTSILENKIDDLAFKLKKISEAYTVIERKNMNLESSVAEEQKSTIHIYNALVKMDNMNKSNYGRIMEEIILAILPVKKFSIYLAAGDSSLDLKYSYNWSNEDKFTEHFSHNDQLFDAIMHNQQILYVARKNDEQIFSEQGILAGPLLNTNSNKVVGMIKIEDIEFSGFVSRNIELFKLVCRWLGAAYYKSLYFTELNTSKIMSSEYVHSTMDSSGRQVNYLTELAKRIHFDLACLHIRITNIERLEEHIRKSAVIFLYDTMKKGLRKTDLIVDKDYRSGVYSLLLPGTNKLSAENVLSKIKKLLLEPSNTDFHNVNYSFQIEILYNNDSAR